MYKFNQHLTNLKLVLVKRQTGDISCSSVIVLRTPRRHYAEGPKCTPPPSKKSHKLLWGTLGIALATGGAVVYAKHRPEARNWLESNAPWANDFVALVYQENTTYWKWTSKQISKASSSLVDFLFGKEGVSPVDIPMRAEQDLEKDAKKAGIKDYKLPPPAFEPLYVEEVKIETPEVNTEATLISTEKCTPSQKEKVNITKTILELEQDMHANIKAAIDNYKVATQACTSYIKALYQIVENDEVDSKMVSGLRGSRDATVSAHKRADEAAGKAKCAIETLDRMLNENGVAAPPDSVFATKRYIKQFRQDLSAAETNFQKEMEKQVIAEKYWNKVEQARQTYKDELQMLFPGIDLNAKTLNLKGQDTDLLILYTLKQVQSYQAKLAELQTITNHKVTKAIECQDTKALMDLKVEDLLRQEKIKSEAEFEKKALEIRAQMHKEMREQLKKQYQVQQDILQDKLNAKEKEVMGKFSRVVSEKMQKEQLEFKKELGEMAGKLKAIEKTLKSRAKAEEEARRSQSMWAAAEALLAATRRPAPVTNIDKEIKALENAGKSDKLVQSVLKGLSPDVREQGIVTEKSLKDHFEVVEKSAAKVALVNQEGSSLPVYVLSWLQSKLLFSNFSDIPRDELENRPVDFTNLDTFDIMHRAKYYMERGELAHALRYVNLLQGAPRAAALSWLTAATRHLEVRQAAEAVMAHASVSGMLYL